MKHKSLHYIAIFLFLLLLTLPTSASPLALHINTAHSASPTWNFWSVNNFTSYDSFTDSRKFADAQRQQKPFMKSVNCVRFIGGRNDGKNNFFRGISPAGQVQSDFTDLLTYIHTIIDAGYIPRIELDNVPTAMSENASMQRYGNTQPPADYNHWKQYIQQLIQALIDEFSYETVASWRFRVGTEPDLYPNHWTATKEQYFKHYDHTAAAVTELIPNADIGPGNILNPADNPSWKPKYEPWGLEIIDHCAIGQNDITNQTGTPMQYFSISWYGRVGKSVDDFISAINNTRNRLNQYPQFKNIPVEVAEFMLLQDENNRRLWAGDASEYSATFNAAIAERAYQLNVRQIYQWTYTTNHGVYTPKAHVFSMLEKMHPGQILDIDTANLRRQNCGAIATTTDDHIYILLYHHQPERSNDISQSIRLTITDPRITPDSKWTLNQWTVDQHHSVYAHALETDAAAADIKPLPGSGRHEVAISKIYGDPGHKLFYHNRTKYENLAKLHQSKTNWPLIPRNNQLQLTIPLPGHCVQFIQLSPPLPQ